jgi:hypothetical protein
MLNLSPTGGSFPSGRHVRTREPEIAIAYGWAQHAALHPNLITYGLHGVSFSRAGRTTSAARRVSDDEDLLKLHPGAEAADPGEPSASAALASRDRSRRRVEAGRAKRSSRGNGGGSSTSGCGRGRR